MASKNMTGIILSGGKNSRMGSNKAFLKIDGIALISRTLLLFRQLFDEIIIVTNTPLAYIDFNVTLVSDIFPNRGALGGLYTGLFFATHTHAFVCACDMPFLDRSFIEYMISTTDNYDIIVPDSGDGLQPLHAIYRRTCLPIMKSLLDRDKLKITSIYNGLRTLTIRENVINSFDPEKKMFLNVNTVDDLKRIIPIEVQTCHE